MHFWRGGDRYRLVRQSWYSGQEPLKESRWGASCRFRVVKAWGAAAERFLGDEVAGRSEVRLSCEGWREPARTWRPSRHRHPYHKKKIIIIIHPPPQVSMLSHWVFPGPRDQGVKPILPASWPPFSVCASVGLDVFPPPAGLPLPVEIHLVHRDVSPGCYSWWGFAKTGLFFPETGVLLRVKVISRETNCPGIDFWPHE